MKRWEIDIPIFEKLLVVIKADTLDKVDEYISDIYHMPLHHEATANLLNATTYSELPDDVIYMGLTNECTTRDVVHECGHVAWQILKLIGGQDEEVYCYLLDFIFDKVTKCIKE